MGGPEGAAQPSSSSGNRPKLVVGLGNPGAKYSQTRHNIGFMVADAFAARFHVSFDKNRYQARFAEARHGKQKIFIVKPETYMNRSGQSVAQALRYTNAEPQHDLLVVYDDVDLPVGKLRLRATGSAGSHNGMRSVLQSLGRTDIPRLRIGIGESNKRGELTGHVLGSFRPAEREAVDAAVARACDAIFCFIEEGIEPAMNQYNREMTLEQDQDSP